MPDRLQVAVMRWIQLLQLRVAEGNMKPVQHGTACRDARLVAAVGRRGSLDRSLTDASVNVTVSVPRND